MKVFFYGLFMDEALLKQKGISVTGQQKGYLEDHTIHISERATLVRSYGNRVYGIVMEISNNDVQRLYSETGVSDYQPEELCIVNEKGDTVHAVCYILPKPEGRSLNVRYAKDLLELAKSKGFPDDYLAVIEVMTYAKDP